MASLLDMLIFDAVYGSWILSLPLFTLAISMYKIQKHPSNQLLELLYSAFQVTGVTCMELAISFIF